MGELDVVAFGDVMVDEYYAIDAVPTDARKQRAGFLGAYAGGMAGNVAATAAAEGLRCAVVASVGADAWGRALVAELAERGVEVRWITERSEPTGRTVIGRLPDGERVMLVAADTHATPPLDAIDDVLASRPRLVYTTALDLAAALQIAEAARGAGARVASDVEEHEARADPALAQRLASACDLVACSDTTGDVLGPRPAGSIRLWLRGARGLAVERDDGTWAGEPDPRARVVDVTGGGDSAVGAACAGLLAGDGPQAIGERALAAATATVARLGVRGRLDEGGPR